MFVVQSTHRIKGARRLIVAGVATAGLVLGLVSPVQAVEATPPLLSAPDVSNFVAELPDALPASPEPEVTPTHPEGNFDVIEEETTEEEDDAVDFPGLDAVDLGDAPRRREG